MPVAVTGHRPEKIGGYDFYNKQRTWIRERLKEQIITLQPQYAITGMALGVDQDYAYVCCELGMPFIAAVPFEGQEAKWPAESQRFYRELLARAQHVQVVSPGGYAAWKMQKRNEWMVDYCRILIAVWDGSSGGTGNCVQYAEMIGRPMVRIDPTRWSP